MTKKIILLVFLLLLFIILFSWVKCRLTFTIHDITRQELKQMTVFQIGAPRVPIARPICVEAAPHVPVTGKVVVLCGPENEVSAKVFQILKDRGFKVTQPCSVNELLRKAYPSMAELKLQGRGLGTKVERVIDVATAGQGKEMAGLAAKTLGRKGCGCQKRKDKLNNITLRREMSHVKKNH